MGQKVVLIADPGIDTAFAIAVALNDPELEVVGLLATAGNVPAEQATLNVHIIVEQIDPARWPRLGGALPVSLPSDGINLHGPGGLGGVNFPSARLRHPEPSDRCLHELLREFPREIIVVCIGPMTVLAHAIDRDPELPSLCKRIVALGGTWHDSGNASAVAEFHIACDPISARKVIHSGAEIYLIPLDVSRKMLYSPNELLGQPRDDSRTARFLRQIVPFGIRATANLYGVEGFHLKDCLGVVAAKLPGLLTWRKIHCDIETQGELTRGMTVFDTRSIPAGQANCHLAVGLDLIGARGYVDQVLAGAI